MRCWLGVFAVATTLALCVVIDGAEKKGVGGQMKERVQEARKRRHRVSWKFVARQTTLKGTFSLSLSELPDFPDS